MRASADYRGVTTSTSLWRSAMRSFYNETRGPSLVSARTRLLVACLFSALVNMQGSESVMGRTESLTLVDRIHLVAVYIFAGALATLFSQLTAEAGQAKQTMWLDPRLLFRVLTIIVQNAIAALLPPNFRAASSMSLVPVDRNSAPRKVLS
jgi:hypothetical protein